MFPGTLQFSGKTCNTSEDGLSIRLQEKDGELRDMKSTIEQERRANSQFKIEGSYFPEFWLGSDWHLLTTENHKPYKWAERPFVKFAHRRSFASLRALLLYFFARLFSRCAPTNWTPGRGYQTPHNIASLDEHRVFGLLETCTRYFH